MKKDISANLYQKFFILCMILQNMPHNTSLTDLVTWQHNGYQNSQIKYFSGHLWHSILIFTDVLVYMIQQSYKYVSSSLIHAENHQHIEIKLVGTGKQ